VGHIVSDCWRLRRDLHRKEWSDGAIFYDVASGDTHHLTLAASQILKLIQSAPCSREDIARSLLAADTEALDTDSLLAIDGMLAHLVELGFIESAEH
jgi:PqqD family protein of HPr-rel-A system